jgi:cell division protein FtsB
MRKITILIVIAAFSHVSFAQTGETSGMGFNDTLIFKKITSLEQRITQQEAELQTLKTENGLLKKEISGLKSSTPKRSAPRNYSISRKGSKQVVVE